MRPLVVKVKDPFVQAAELASFVSAVTRNLPIATPRSSSPAATFFPTVSDAAAASGFTNAAYITTAAGSPVLEAASSTAPFASPLPLPVPFHTQLQPVALYRNHMTATPVAAYPVNTIPIASFSHPTTLSMPLVATQLVKTNSPAPLAPTASPAASPALDTGDKMKLERRSIIPALSEQMFENTKDLAAKAVESVESSIRSVVEGGFIGKKSNTGVSVPEARSGVFGSIRKAISDALARNHEVSGEIVRAKERRKIDEIVKVVDHVSSDPAHKAHIRKQIQPILKLASDPSIASLADTLSPAPVLPVATSPVMPLPVDSIESSSELDHLYPFKRSSYVSDSTSETQDQTTSPADAAAAAAAPSPANDSSQAQQQQEENSNTQNAQV